MTEFVSRRKAECVCICSICSSEYFSLVRILKKFIIKDGGFGILLLFFDHVHNLSGIIFGNKVAIKVILKCRDMEMRDTS
jgi:hypothetical protein